MRLGRTEYRAAEEVASVMVGARVRSFSDLHGVCDANDVLLRALGVRDEDADPTDQEFLDTLHDIVTVAEYITWEHGGR